MTMSCIWVVFEKQIVLRTKRLMRVRKVRCLRSIFCVRSYTYCLPLSRFCSYVVISIASDAYPIATRPWPGGEKRIGGRTSHRTDFEAIESFLLPCTATGVSLLAVWRRIGATRRGQPWTPAVALPHEATG